MDEEHTILNHYNLATPNPIAWPAEKDSDDTDDDDISSKKGGKTNLRRSKTRYSALERSGSDRRSLVPGSEKTGDGVENLVQRDETDPLGGADSVVRILRQKGIAVDDDQRLRNRFLLSSTTFSPNLYLSQIHSNTSTQSLLQGLEFLSRSIDQKSASLKVLVESNFERFVRAKTTIDSVYAEMRNQGSEVEAEKPRTHSRVTSRSSAHFRNASGQGPPNPGKAVHKPLLSDKKKNALTKESEYGVQGIKGPLIEVAVKAEEIWGPALGGREKEGVLRLIMDSVAQTQKIFNTSLAVSECIKRKDYEHLVQEYSQARKYVDQARDIASNATNRQVQLTDSQIHQIVITGRMWSEVEERVDDFKRGIWRRLTNTQGNILLIPGHSAHEEYMALIAILLELGVDDNPIWVWLLSRYDYLKNKITTTSERLKVEIEVLRRRLANAEKPAPQVIALHLKTSAQKQIDDQGKGSDTPAVIELWDMVLNSITNLASVQNGILGEVIDFWDKSQMFMDGRVENKLPAGIDGQSRVHHRLSADGSRQLQDGVVELMELLRDVMFSFFADPPIEDISLLYSPIPQTPNTPSAPMLAAPSALPYQDRRFKFDTNHPPPPSPRKGEFWDEFAFWPPHANSLSGVFYLGKILTLLGAAASEMLSLRPVVSGTALSEKLKTMIAGARERSTRAICAAWNRDAEICKFLEDWTRLKEKREFTTMPTYFNFFETAVISGIQKILYIPDVASTKPGSTSLISPPPAKLLQMIRSQFVMTLYKVLSSMVENAEKPIESDIPDWTSELSITNGLEAGIMSKATKENSFNVRSRNVQLLLTLSNVKLLQSDIVPQLISQFETNFSVRLTEESKKVGDAFIQIEAKVFHSYTRPIADQLSMMIQDGISSPAWVPTTSRPVQVQPYVYEALLLLVSVHTEVFTTASSLVIPILSHLLEHMSTSFLAAFQARGRYSLPALMQATLDLEFVAQTMSQYTTDRISQIQNEIYVSLDRCTDHEARARSKSEVLEIGVILKKLREGTKSEFACFKKQRGQKER